MSEAPAAETKGVLVCVCDFFSQGSSFSMYFGFRFLFRFGRSIVVVNGFTVG